MLIFRFYGVPHQSRDKALAYQWGVVEVIVVDQVHDMFVVG